jgi:hypothetical protein
MRRKVDLQRPIHLPNLASVFVFFGGEKLLPFFSLLIFLLTLKIKAIVRARRRRRKIGLRAVRVRELFIKFYFTSTAVNSVEFIAFYYEPAQGRYTKNSASAPARINNSGR